MSKYKVKLMSMVFPRGLMTCMIFLILFFPGCREKEVRRDTPDNVAIKQPQLQQMRLDPLDSLAQIDGCSELFSLRTDSLEEKLYVFASNITTFCLVNINGTQYRLMLDKEKSIITAADYVHVFTGHGYTVIISAQLQKQVDEGGYYIGKVSIVKDGQSFIADVHGMTGC